MKYTILLIVAVLLLSECGQYRKRQQKAQQLEELYQEASAESREKSRIEDEGQENVENEQEEPIAEADSLPAAKFIHWVKTSNREELSNHISYPLRREYPIPPIANKQEFLKRYDEIFDEILLKMIAESDPAVDWQKMGWHGIMLNSGEVWLDFGGGSLSAVSYQSEYEARCRDELIRADKNSLHESLKEFERPIFVMETETYRIRVDDLGDQNYRYASWKSNTPMSDKPDLILSNGICEVEGTIRNECYSFVNGNYLYKCWRWTGEPASLTVDKGEDTRVLYEVAKSCNYEEY